MISAGVRLKGLWTRRGRGGLGRGRKRDAPRGLSLGANAICALRTAGCCRTNCRRRTLARRGSACIARPPPLSIGANISTGLADCKFAVYRLVKDALVIFSHFQHGQVGGIH